MAGPIIKLPAAALRSSGLEVMGSGGSIPPAAIFETFPRLWGELAAGGELCIDAEPVPLTDVAEALATQQPKRPAGWCSSPELCSWSPAPAPKWRKIASPLVAKARVLINWGCP